MEKAYEQVIKEVSNAGGSLLDAMHAVQEVEGYLTQPAMEALAEAFHRLPSEIYDCASFYNMYLFKPPCEFNIQICEGAPCHVAGADKVIQALEEELEIKMGECTPDGKFSLSYTECIGQCQASPSILVNGTLYKDMSAEKARTFIQKGGLN